MDKKQIKRKIAIEGLILLPVLLFASLCFASGEFGIGLFFILIYAIVRFLIWSIKALEGKDRIKETGTFVAIVGIFRFVIALLIALFIISVVKKSISRHLSRNAEKTQIALEEKWEAEERKKEEAQIALQEKNDTEEKENAKQIEIVNWSIGDKQSNVLSLLTPQIRVTLKNNSYDMAERIDAILTYYTSNNNYMIKDVIVTNITGGGVFPPKSTVEFTKTIALNPPNQEYEMGLAVSRVKFKEYYYAVFNEKIPSEDQALPIKYYNRESIARFYTLKECEQEIDDIKKKNNTISAYCMREDNRISNIFNDRPIDCWYIRYIIESKGGTILQYVNILSDQELSKFNMNPRNAVANYCEEGIKVVNKNNTKGKIYSISPGGTKTTCLDTLK